MQYSQIPPKFPIPFGAQAGGGFINPIPQASQIGIQDGRASLTDGFPPLTFLPVGAGGTPPFGQDFNGLLNQITLWTQWQNAGALVKYDAAFASTIGGYPFGALLASTTAGGAWISTVDDNISNPDSGGAGWVQIGSGVSGGISTGTDSGSANVMTATVSPVPTAYNNGAIYIIQKAAFPNNGAMTGNIAGLGSRPIVMPDGSALPGGAWPTSGNGILKWNQATTSLVLLNPAATGAATGGISVSPELVVSLNIASLPAPSGALSLADSIAQRVVSDGGDREVTLQQVSDTIGVLLGQSLTTNGYQKLPGGIILQWGRKQAPTSGHVDTAPYPIAFPNQAFFGTFMIEQTAGASSSYFGIPGLTSLSIDIAPAAWVGTSFYRWFVIGY